MTSFTSLGLLAAFGAGVLSFLAPCVLPLVPGYLAYLAGISREAPQTYRSMRFQISFHASWFVLGFTVLYILLGAAVGQFGGVLRVYQPVLERIGGLLLILFGAALTGVVRIPFLSSDHRIEVQSGRAAWWRSGLTGMTFGASWSPCTGPILGTVLLMTAESRMFLEGAAMMLAFALGLGLPFVVIGLLADRAKGFLRGIARYTAIFSSIVGVILILLGILLLTGLFSSFG